MEPKLESEYTITEKEYVQASSLHARLTKKQIAISSIVIIALATLAYVAGDGAVRGGAIGGLIGGIGAYTLIRLLINPWRTKRMYQSYAAIQESCTVILLDQGIRFRTELGESLIEWRHILKWRENDQFVLIYQAPHLYHLIPKRLGVIAEQLVEKLAPNVGAGS